MRMVEALRCLGHRVGVICPIAWTDLLRSDAASRTQRRAATEDREGLERFPVYYFTPRVLRGAYGAFMWHSIKGAVHELSDQLQPTAVIGYWAHPDGRCAVEAARFLGVPSLVMTGGSDVLLLTKNRSRRRQVIDVLRDADQVVAVSDDLQRQLVLLGVASSKISVIRRGVDDEIFCPGDQTAARQELGLSVERRHVVWAGRLTPVKGLDVLLDAISLLIAEGSDVQVQLIGSGELEAFLQAEVAKRGLDNHIKFVGPVRDPRVLAQWYRAADVIALPSLSEGIPNVLLESMSCGAKFVASKVGGIAEIADANVDRLVPPGNPRALAAALKESMSDGLVRGPRTFMPNSCLDAARELIGAIQTATLAPSMPRRWRRAFS